jgi:Ribbon-helix-helix protein, copG family
MYALYYSRAAMDRPRNQTGKTGCVLTFRADAGLIDGLDRLFERDGIAQSEAIRRAVREFLAAKGIAIGDTRTKPKRK